jgi:hypothetical protein
MEGDTQLSWSEQDKSALLALVTRFVRAFDARKRHQDQKAELERAILADSLILQNLRVAMSVFGVDTTAKGWSEAVRLAAGTDAFDKALLAGGRPPAVHYAGIGGPQKTASYAGEADASKTVRDQVLALLNEAGSAGTTATALRKAIEASRDDPLHYKTVGMTLYRLSQDGLARREGRTWFAVPETANPGARTPGSNNEAT